MVLKYIVIKPIPAIHHKILQILLHLCFILVDNPSLLHPEIH